jgi:peroxiredoxin
MAVTPSTMLALGTKTPPFNLPSVTGNKIYSLADFESYKALLVMFICQHCPYVQHIKSELSLSQLWQVYEWKSLGIVAISSNDAAKYPDDSPAELARFAEKENFGFPFLYDETQQVARDFTAACTPDFFLFDKSRQLIYRGQLDDSRPGNGKPVTGKDLRAAIDAVLEDKPPIAEQKPSIGCNIKWKPGREPAYFART